MYLEIAADAFNGPAELPYISMLLHCCSQGRHDWVPDEKSLAAAAQYFSEHLPTLADSLVTLGRKGTVQAAAWTAKDTSVRRVSIEAANLSECTHDLCQRPAVLIVENLNSDGCFVRTLIHVFRADRLRRALDERWLEIQHGGGSDLVAVAKTIKERYHEVVRVIALLDSDRLTPGESTKARDKAATLSNHGIRVHVLELREAENYVPNRVLARRGNPSEASHKLTSLNRMTPQQRGYFDMKKGFRPTRGRPAGHNEPSLFSDLPPTVIRGLREGYGHDLLEHLLEECKNLTEQDFAALGTEVVAELRSLLTMIASVV